MATQGEKAYVRHYDVERKFLADPQAVKWAQDILTMLVFEREGDGVKPSVDSQMSQAQ